MGLVEYTIVDLLDKAVNDHGADRAVAFQGEFYTWQETDRLSDLMAERFWDEGIAEGDHVGLWSENGVSFPVTLLALLKIGAIPALLNFNYRRQELIRVLELSEITWLCGGSTPALRETPELMQNLVRQPEIGLKGFTDIREETIAPRRMLEEAGSKNKRIRSRRSPHDTAVMLYTTGTSAIPKCVMHSHYSLVNNAIQTAERAGFCADDRICMSQPLFHIFPLITGLICSMYCGFMLCMVSRFKSDDILSCIERYACTVLNGVPTNFLRLISSPAFPEYRTDSLRLSVIGGAPLSEQQIEDIREALPTVHIMKDYGLTEGCNLCNSDVTDSEQSITRSVGRPYDGISFAIADVKSGEHLPPGEKGEIVVRGYNVMQGYYRSPKGETVPPSIDAEGWLHTGDLGMIDAEGYVSIAGRIKSIIIRGGENIAPAEIEKEILRYDPVLDTVVLGSPHPVLGEEVIACLMLRNPEEYAEEELKALLRVRLAAYKIPAFFMIYDYFPLTPGGKVDVRAMREDVYAKARILHEGDDRYDYKPKQRAEV